MDIVNIVNIVIDIFMIGSGYVANRKWKDTTLGPMLMIGGGIFLIWDLCEIFLKN